MKKDPKYFMQMAIDISRNGMETGKGGPFGCVVVKDGKVVGKGSNEVLLTNDPTAHAEVVAIREACRNLGTFQLDGCEIYASCEPCPMCLGAIYWARPEKVYFANTKSDAASIGFDDQFIYGEIELPPDKRKIAFEHISEPAAMDVFMEWKNMNNKTLY